MDNSNPLKVWFYVIVIILCMSFLDFILIFSDSVKLDNLLIRYGIWSLVHRIIVLAASCIFIVFYFRKSIVAWYVILGLIIVSVPFLLLMDIPNLTKNQAFILVPIFCLTALLFLIKNTVIP